MSSGDASAAAQFWALVVIAALGAWVVAGSMDIFDDGYSALQEQKRLVVPE